MLSQPKYETVKNTCLPSINFGDGKNLKTSIWIDPSLNRIMLTVFRKTSRPLRILRFSYRAGQTFIIWCQLDKSFVKYLDKLPHFTGTFLALLTATVVAYPVKFYDWYHSNDARFKLHYSHSNVLCLWAILIKPPSFTRCSDDTYYLTLSWIAR